MIWRMSVENPLGARHAFTANCSSPSRSRASPSTWSNGGGRPARGWRTFLHNHAPDIAAMDLFVVPTISFDLLYALVIVGSAAPLSSGSTSQQIRRPNGSHVRSRRHFLGMRLRTTSSAIATGSMAAAVTRRLRAMGIRDKPTAPASPWQNGVAERLIGSIRRECVGHIIVLGEMHLRRVLKSYADYYNRASEHPSGYVIDEKRFCWLGCDPAGYFGFCLTRLVMD